MKKSILVLIVSICTLHLMAQDKEYVELFFGTVKNANVENHIKNEKASFAKLHADRIKRGEIIGWDMWQLVSPGDNNGETTFMYATIYNNLDKANLWGSHMNDYVKRVAGNNAATFTKTMNSIMSDYTTMNDIIIVAKAGDKANGQFDEKGNNPKIKYLVMNEMLVDNYHAGDYEKMESETFKSYRKDNEKLQGWSLAKVLNVYGENKINYYTHDFYASLQDIYDLREKTNGYSEENIKFLKDIEKLRVLKNSKIYELIDSKR